MGELVKVGQPTHHRKREYFTMPATGDEIHEVNLDYLAYPLIPVKAAKVGSSEPSSELKTSKKARP